MIKDKRIDEIQEDYHAVLIVGPGGAGKTWRAREEAEKRGGDYAVADWEDLLGSFGLGAVMRSNPATVIVEGLPASLTGRQAEFLKAIIGGDLVTVREKYKEPRVAKPPFFIFTMLASRGMDFSERLFRRFKVIEV